MGHTHREILVLTIAVAVGVLALVTLVIVLNKVWREAREAFDRRRRAALEPDIFRYAGAGDARSIREYLPLPLTPRDRAIVETILLDVAGMLKGASRERIASACEALGLAAEAIEGLRARRWWQRAEAAEKLGVMGSRQAVEALVTALEDPSDEVRMRAARALGRIRGRTSIRPLVQALSDPSRWSAIRLAEILIGAGDEAVDELLRAFAGLPAPARVSALDVLGRIRTPRAADLLKASIRDPNADVRARAAHAMGLLADPGFAGALMGALADEAWAVRAMAAKALGRLGAEAAIPALAGRMSDREWWVRSNAGDALRALGPAGRKALILTLDATDTYARHQAVAQLEEGGIIDEYIADLASADAARRVAAIAFVEKVIALGRVDRLSHQAVEHTQEGVRRKLLEVLKREPEGAS